MFEKKSCDFELQLTAYPTKTLITKSLQKSVREEDDARERMVAARREQQRLSLLRRLAMPEMFCLS